MDRHLFPYFLFLLICAAAFAQAPAPPVDALVLAFRDVQVDAGKVTGSIRSFQGLNGPPFPVMEGLPNLTRQYKALHIDMVRTHDIMGPTDIAARYSEDNPLLKWLVPDSKQRAAMVRTARVTEIFPDWNADPEKAESYHFAASDKFIQAIRESGAEVYYRIGRSFGADYTDLPDLDKFAAVVKHVAMHYNQGWANGFHDNIRYWEFWNEPDLPLFWTENAGKILRALRKDSAGVEVG